MEQRQGNGHRGLNQGNLSALEIVSEYSVALAAGDSEKMNALHSPDFVLDWVYADAFEDRPHSRDETKEFWPSWLASFPEMDYEVTRTIAAEKVVVTQWIFTGTNTGTLGPESAQSCYSS